MDNEQSTNTSPTTTSSSNMMWIILAMIILLIVGVIIYTRMNSGTETTLTPTPAGELGVPAASPGQTGESTDSATVGVREVTVTGSPFKFEPAEIKVKQGDTVRVKFVNAEGTHDFVVPDFNVQTKQLSTANAEETVEFVADKKGSFEYFCSVGNHREMGMKGMLIVE
jgi:plastocyanin